jgi:hypothetical protein
MVSSKLGMFTFVGIQEPSLGLKLKPKQLMSSPQRDPQSLASWAVDIGSGD